MRSDQKILGGIIIFLMLILSYAPITDEIHDIALNISGSSTSFSLAVAGFLDPWWGVFQLILAVFMLGLSINEAIRDMNT